MISAEQVAHDLALVYLANRYGPEVTGEFSVDTSYSDDREVTGSGSVTTERFPGVDEKVRIRVGTGDRYFFKLLERKVSVETGEYRIDPLFRQMITDYRKAYARFLAFLKSDEPGGTEESPELEEPTQ